MFQFRRFPTYDYFIHHRLTDLHLPGCPIRISPDIALAYSSPRLIAVNRVLLRLPVPRHPPCALCSLTFFIPLAVFIVRWLLSRPIRLYLNGNSVTENYAPANRKPLVFDCLRIMRFSKFEIFEFCHSFDNCINYPYFKILYLFKTVDTVSYLSFVLHFFIRFSRNNLRLKA